MLRAQKPVKCAELLRGENDNRKGSKRVGSSQEAARVQLQSRRISP